MNCDNCGNIQLFHGSWYNPEKDSQETVWIEEWFPELVQILRIERNVGVTHELADGSQANYHYHLTRGDRTVERWLEAIDKVGFSPQEAVGRRNWHIRRKSK